MELLKGTLLSDYEIEDKLNITDIILNIFIQLLRALEYVHSRDIIYKDLKPQNIMINDEIVKLMDFGLAKLTHINEKKIQGTVLYFAPDILHGDTGYSTDIFSLGLVIFELISDSFFFNIRSRSAKNIINILSDQKAFENYKQDRLSHIEDMRFKEILDKMTNYKIDKRYQACSEIIHDINLYFGREFEYESFDTRQSYYLGNSFANRKSELNNLISNIHSREKTSLFLYSGSTGIGKTRLFSEFKKYCRLNNILFFEANCMEGDIKEYNSFGEILLQTIILSPKKLLDKYGSYLRLILPQASRLSNYSPYKIVDDPKIIRDNLLQSISDFFIEFAINANKPVILYFNDIQWIDEGSADLISMMISLSEINSLENAHLIFYGNINENKIIDDKLINNILKHGNSIRKEDLQPFSEESVREYIQNVFGSHFIHESIKKSIKEIRDKVGGNPLFLEELIKSLVENADIYKDRRYWKLKKPVRNADIPENLIDLSKQRISRLLSDDNKKTLLQILSLLRINLEIKHIKHIISRISSRNIAEMIIELERLEIINAINIDNKIIYSFSSSLIKEIIQETIADKAGLSILLANTLKEMQCKYSDIFLEEIAYHYKEGKDNEKAIKYYILCGDNAQKKYFNSKAIFYYKTVLELLGDKEIEKKLNIYIKIASILESIGKWNDAISIMENSLNRAQEGNHLKIMGKIYNLLAKIKLNRGKYEEGKIFIDKSMDIYKKTGDICLLSIIINNQLSYYYQSFRHDEAINYFDKYKDILRKTNDLMSLAEAEKNLGNIFYTRSDYKKAMEYYIRYKEISDNIGYKRGIASADGNIGNIYLMLGEYKKALTAYEKEREIAKKYGLKELIGKASHNIALALYSIDDLKGAIKNFEIDRKILREIGDELGSATAIGNMGVIYCDLGQFDKSLKCLKEYKRIAEKYGDIRSMGIANGNIGNTYFIMGDFHNSLKYYREKEKTAKEINNKRGLGIAYGNIGNIYIELKEYDRSFIYLQKSIDILKDFGSNLDLLIETHLSISKILIKRNEKEEALINLDTALEYAKKINDPNLLQRLKVDYILIEKINNKEKAISKLNSLLQDELELETIGTIYHHLFLLTKKIAYKEKAIKIFNDLYNDKPYYKYKKRLDSLR